MQLLRDVLKSSLAASLSTLTPLDLLAAAWPVVAGSALAARTHVADYRASILTLAVDDDAWHAQAQSAAKLLRGEVSRVSGLPLADILVVRMPQQTSTAAQV